MTATLELENLKHALKVMVIKECDKAIAPDLILDDAPLIGGDLQLDSLDALQICLAVKDRYDVRIEGGTMAYQALQSINTLAHTIMTAKASI